MRQFFLMIFITVSLAAAGCGSSQPTAVSVPNLPQAMPVDPPGGSHMLTANTYAGDALHSMLLLRMGSGGGILTTSFVDIHDFEKTSAFGRVASQQVGSRLGQYGFRVIEARLASALGMTPRAGEFMLTREAARLLSDTYDAGAVLVGSYSDEGGNVFVSARVVRLSDNVIMAAYEYYLPRDADVSRLMVSGRDGGPVSDSVWQRHSGRTPAFAPCGANSVASISAPVSRASAPSSSAAASKTAVSGKKRTTPVPAAETVPAVPRHVDPEAKAPVPVLTKKPTAPMTGTAASAPAAPTPASSAPVEKDAPPSQPVPGGV